MAYRAFYQGICTVSIALLAQSAHASAFQLQEQNVTNMGTAYAGSASWAQDASTAFYNPAGLVRLDNKQVVLSSVLAHAKVDLRVKAATSNTGDPVDGRLSDNPGGFAAIPAFHYSARIDDKKVFGLTMAPSFGMRTEYSKDSAARYVATISDIKVMNISPALGYIWNDKWSLGVGYDANWITAQLNARVGSGTPETDGFQKNNASDWGYGWHAGVMYTPSEQTRVGLSYRSMVHVAPRGISKTLLSGVAQYQELTTSIDLPDMAILSVTHQMDPALTILADAQWTLWKRIDILRLKYSGVHTGSGVRTMNVTEIPMYFNNALRVSVGANYDWKDPWSFRAGVAYDPTPVRNEYRTARAPDANRYWLSAGARYRWANDLRLEMGYSHLFFDSVNVDDSGPISANSGLHVTAANMTGRYKTHADILGVQISWDFL